MKSSKGRRAAPNTVAFVYAGYKWLEEHADEVERWSQNVMKRSHGTRYDKVVLPAARAVDAAAKWAKNNRSGGFGRRSRKPLKK